MPILKPEKKMVEALLRECLVDNNKFIRAWSYNVFYELSIQYPEHKKSDKKIIWNGNER
jgi:hypothetical protein